MSTRMQRVKAVSRYVLAIFMIVAGGMHFVYEDFYLRIMPLYLPTHRLLVFLSGVAEIVIGVMLLIPRFTHLAAWGAILPLIAVFPANIASGNVRQIDRQTRRSPTTHKRRCLVPALFRLLCWRLPRSVL